MIALPAAPVMQQVTENWEITVLSWSFSFTNYFVYQFVFSCLHSIYSISYLFPCISLPSSWFYWCLPLTVMLYIPSLWFCLPLPLVQPGVYCLTYTYIYSIFSTRGLFMTLVVEAVIFSETLVNIYQTIQWNFPEDRHHCHESLKSYLICTGVL